MRPAWEDEHPPPPGRAAVTLVLRLPVHSRGEIVAKKELSGMNASDTHSNFSVFADRVTAEAAIQTLSRMKKGHQIELDAAALVAKG